MCSGAQRHSAGRPGTCLCNPTMRSLEGPARVQRLAWSVWRHAVGWNMHAANISCAGGKAALSLGALLGVQAHGGHSSETLA